VLVFTDRIMRSSHSVLLGAAHSCFVVQNLIRVINGTIPCFYYIPFHFKVGVICCVLVDSVCLCRKSDNNIY